MSTIYSKIPNGDGERLYNMTGADLVANEFTVMGGKALKAMEAIASTAIGSFEDLVGKVVSADDFVTGEDAFATAEAAVYWKPATGEFSNLATVGYYKVGYVKEPKTSTWLNFTCVSPTIVSTDVSDLETIVTGITAEAGIPFRKTATLTSAAAGAAVHVLTDADVGSKTAYLLGAILKVDGSTAWTDSTGTIVKIQDTNGTPVVGLTYAKAELKGNAVLVLGSTGVTIGDAVAEGTGFTAAKGLDIIADANFAAGDNIKITIYGYMA